MICPDCRLGKHKLCRGKTWCDCQHREGINQPEVAMSEETVYLGQHRADTNYVGIRDENYVEEETVPVEQEETKEYNVETDEFDEEAESDEDDEFDEEDEDEDDDEEDDEEYSKEAAIEGL